MKKLLVALAAVLVTAATSYGQGQINFNNLNALTDANTYGIWQDSAKTVGAASGGVNLTAQLFLNTGGTLTALTPATSFFTDAGSEFLLQPVDITVPGVASGGTADFVVQVWQTSFNSYQAAVDGNGWRGQSDLFNNKVGGGTLPPENTVFNGFVLVPEPSTIALGLIGAGALLLRRRK
jgi:hypothetical protein